MNASSPSTHDRSASRREFLRATSAVALATGLVWPRSVHAAGDEAIRVALIGCGGRGAGAAYNALLAHPKVRITALADAFREPLERTLNSLRAQADVDPGRVDVADDHQFVGLDAYQQALASDVDVVLLCSPPGFRPAQYHAAVEAGKHVFMEKPVAVDAPGMRRVLAANEVAKKKGLAVCVGHHLRHEDKHSEVIQQIHDGAIGELVYLRAYFNTGRIWVRPRTPDQTEMQYQVNNWYHFNWLSGDHIVEQHVHDLDVCNWMMNDHPVEAQALGGRQMRADKDYGEIYDHHAVEFTYASGVRLFSYCRQISNCWNSFSEHAHGTKGQVNIEGHGSSVLEVVGQKPVVRKRGADGHQVEQDRFFAALVGGQPFNEVDYSATSTMTAILGRMASYSGQLVRWDEAVNSQLELGPKALTWEAEPPVQPGPDGEYATPVPGVASAF
ncbi:MAG: Gfo/Idh/MocA family oxidoreductase [Pirellulaceae bacterium]|nr:Gfo/Idh/MocA family oxidoreductase [Pirellulaceae bacterium]